MVYVNLKGRIGNNLFQLATAASLAHLHNTNFIANITDYWCLEPDNCLLNDYLVQFKDNIFRKVRFETACPSDTRVFNELNSEFSPIPFENNISLNGWFQSEKYFVDPIVRELFDIDINTYNYIKEKYGNLLFSDEPITSINVRRGDYLKLPQYYSICSMPYYNRAIDLIGRSNKFLVISDDIEWCKRNFKGSDFYFILDEKPVVDLYLQSFCTNNIISNSTFSWWGAWLNKNANKIVVAPTPWVGKFHKHVSTKDLIPEKWTQIENPVERKYKIQVSLIEIKTFLKDLTSKIKRKVKKVLLPD